jgi:hypothetical protein
MDFTPIPPQIIALEVLVGASIGAVIGMFVDLVLKRGKRGVLIDALLGIIGFVGGAVATAIVKVPPNTVTYRAGDVVIHTTVRHFQYPYRVAFVFAIMLPLLFEFIRTRWIIRRQRSHA